MLRWLTDILWGRAGDPQRLVTVAAGTAVVVVVHAVGVNNNWLYLLILLAVYVVIAVALRRVRDWIVLFTVLAGIAMAPRKIPAPEFLDPATPSDRTKFVAVIPDTQTWRYTFTLNGLDRHVAECGLLRGTLHIDGDRLQDRTIDLRITGTVLMTEPIFGRSNGLDTIEAAPVLDGVRQFSVLLTAKAGEAPAIRLGPEIHGMRVFSDSVYLEMKNANCTVVYETLRQVEPAAHPSHVSQ